VVPVARRLVAASLVAVLLAGTAACGAPSASPDPSGRIGARPSGPAATAPGDAPRPDATPAAPHASDGPLDGATPRPDDGAMAPPDVTVFDYDASVPLHARVRGLAGSADAVMEHVTFDAPDGQRVPALLSIPRAADGPVPCVVLGHGFRGDKASFPLWQRLAHAGFGAFAIDARFHGDRRDAAALQRLETEPELLARMLRETVIDMRRGIDYLVTRPECDPARIGYLGASMGGFVGSLLAGADERVQAPVLLVSGADWATMLDSTEMAAFRARATPRAIAHARRVLDPVDPKHWIPRVSPRPVLMIAGDRDRSVPPASARALHAAALEPKTIVWYEGGHSLPSAAESDRVMATIAIWLLEHLGT
jgi:hypothetical protein